MKRMLIGLLAALLTLPALAERKHSVGEYDIHYIAFNSGFLQPDIAAAAGTVRSKTGAWSTCRWSGWQTGRRPVSGGEEPARPGSPAHLQAAQGRRRGDLLHGAVPLRLPETLRFRLTVQPTGAQPFSSSSTEFFPDR